MAEAPAGDGSDEELLGRVRAGETQAAALLYDRHHRALYAHALSLLQDGALAEDVVHETFLRVLEPRPLPSIACAKAFLHTVARNLALDLLRGTARQGDHRASFARTVLARGTTEDDDPRREAVLAALDTLPQDQRETVSLKVFSGLTFAEIAEVMSVPAGTAASRYRYACETLAEILQGDRP